MRTFSQQEQMAFENKKSPLIFSIAGLTTSGGYGPPTHTIEVRLGTSEPEWNSEVPSLISISQAGGPTPKYQHLNRVGWWTNSEVPRQ